MEIKEINTSIVIIGNEHNPTIFSIDFFNNFLLKNTEIEIIKDTIVVSPAISRISFNGGGAINLDRKRLDIAGKSELKIYTIAQNYSNTLKHIKCTNIGFNFIYSVNGEEIKRFKETNFNRTFNLNTVGLNLNRDNKNIFAEISFTGENDIIIVINFDYSVTKTLGEENFNFEANYNTDLNICKTVISEIINTQQC